MFENAKWIWKSQNAGKDEYVLFAFDFRYAGGDAIFRLSADSDYNLLINGELVSFGQYHNYEENTVYDEIDISSHLKVGKNRIEILVWYYGESNYSYSVGKAGLIFELMVDGRQEAKSDESILSAYEPHYRRGYCKNITLQLGYGFEYDATKDEPIFTSSVSVERAYPVAMRPIKKLIMGEAMDGHLICSENKRRYLYDFGKEAVGFLSFSVDCREKCALTISYGEYLVNGDVCRIIESRDFSFSYIAKKGKNSFCNAFRRLGCRYVVIECDVPFSVIGLQLLPTDYPLEEIPFDTGDPLRQRIYQTAVRTLTLCMHEHYEDCPWREQALYTMDSRNQMLCTYYAFGEYDFAKASLALFARSRPCGGILPICAPCDAELTIPSFSLHYFTQVLEYLEYSEDADFVESIYGRLLELIGRFDERICDGLLEEFEGDIYWNFYEWKTGLSGGGKNRFNLILNALYLKALQSMSLIATRLQKENLFEERAEKLKESIYRYFYDKDIGLFVLGKDAPLITELGNYLCIITGVIGSDRAKELIGLLKSCKDRITLTLSMRCFEYDALLSVDKEGYRDEILSDIDMRWGRMLEEGATSFWETEEGYKDFGGAGSLCHGWSAIPVYYYHKLLG